MKKSKTGFIKNRAYHMPQKAHGTLLHTSTLGGIQSSPPWHANI
jgi:hypothetical protein